MDIRAILVLAQSGISGRSISGHGLALILAALLIAGSLDAIAEGQLRFRIYDQSYGLDDLVVRDLLQDRDGFLWLATHTGLYRYDGRNFRRYGVQDGLPGDWVTNLAEDLEGNLWVAGVGGVSRRTTNGFQTVLPTSENIRFSPARGTPLAVAGRGRVYVSTLSGVLEVRMLRPGKGDSVWSASLAPPVLARFMMKAPGGGGSEVVPIAISDAGHLCTLGDEAGTVFRCLEPDSGRVVGDTKIPPRPRWTSLVQAGDGTWVAATGQGEIFRLKFGGARPEQLSIPYSGRGRVRMLSDQSLLVPAEEGFTLYRQGKQLSVRQADGHPPDPAECFLEDREGNLWVGTAGSGLLQWLGPSQWRGWDTTNGLPGPAVSQIVAVPDGTLWVGTNRGLATKHPSAASFSAARMPPAVALRAPVFGLAVGEDGELWFANERGVLYRWHPMTGRTLRFSAENGVALDVVCDLLWDGEGLWIADTRGLGRLRQTNGLWRFERVFPGSQERPVSVYSLSLETANRLWAATSAGLISIEGGRVTRTTAKDGLLHDNVFGLTLGPQGDVWVHYRHPLGITRIQRPGTGQIYTHYRKEQGIASDKVFSLAADRLGRVWAGTERGLSVLQDGIWTTFTRDDGLVWNDCSVQGLFEDEQGFLWIGTSRGLSRFRPPDRMQPQPLTVSILGLQADGGLLVEPEPEGVLQTTSKFLISFAAPRYVNQDLITFRYRLGESAEWIESSDSQVYFANVGPGDYEFQVQARMGVLPWSPPAVLRLHVPTPWWRQWWAMALAAWMIAASARILWSWRYRRILKRQGELESAVSERTRELEEQRQKAEAASEFKNQILANVSHEMRTPLNGILGFTDLILSTNLSDEQREHLQTVQASGKTLVDIIEDLLDFAAFESGELVLRETNCRLADVLDQTARSVRHESQKKGLELRVQVAEEVPENVTTDVHRLRQILMNLLSNAVKFTDQGTVTLEAGLAERDPEQKGMLRRNEVRSVMPPGKPVAIRFVVRDTGIGIAPEQLAVVFEPFRQLDGTRQRRHGGAGLGLAIVKRLVDAFGGNVSVESTPGGGSEFRVVLPMWAFTKPASSAIPLRAHGGEDGASVGTGGGSGPERDHVADVPLRKVLIAEDNPVNQTLLTRILKTRGLHVVAVANGQAAVDAAQVESFDLILMDIQMPVMDGIEATRCIRRDEALSGRRTPIIAVTANGLFQCRQECLEVGMDGYVVKPFGPANLFDAIAKVTRQGSAEGLPQATPVTGEPAEAGDAAKTAAEFPQA